MNKRTHPAKASQQFNTFSKDNFQSICDQLASEDEALQLIIKEHGYPPMWTRPNSFEIFVHIILEQQVSLASALAALNKLKEKAGIISPATILSLSDEELKACYVSRQKTIYIRNLAKAIMDKEISLEAMETMSEDAVREQLIKLKGIGNWTIDVYLMFVLQRADIFPVGDLAAVNALKRARSLAKDTPATSLLLLTEKWRPNRTIATMILWHHYLSAPIRTKPSVTS